MKAATRKKAPGRPKKDLLLDSFREWVKRRGKETGDRKTMRWLLWILDEGR